MATKSTDSMSPDNGVDLPQTLKFRTEIGSSITEY